MPFIGNKPSAVPLTSADIADSIITSAKIVDGTIVNADINASSAIAISKISATGTSLQSLRMNSGATALEFATISSGFTSGTAVATTSGTAFDFTGIPATAKLIIINFAEVSLSGGDNIYVLIGDSGGFETTGYNSSSAYVGSSSSYTSATDAFTIAVSASVLTPSGILLLTLLDSSTNTWSSNHTLSGYSDKVLLGGGNKSLSSTLTQVRITRGGSNTFDAGKLNIMYI